MNARTRHTIARRHMYGAYLLVRKLHTIKSTHQLALFARSLVSDSLSQLHIIWTCVSRARGSSIRSEVRFGPSYIVSHVWMRHNSRRKFASVLLVHPALHARTRHPPHKFTSVPVLHRVSHAQTWNTSCKRHRSLPFTFYRTPGRSTN